jgi:exo-beta-1,3-glucanase (GH17 family)
MTENNINHMIDVAGATVQYLLGPIIAAAAVGALAWWRARITAAQLAKKVDDTASALADKTDKAAQIVVDKTDQQTVVLTQQNKDVQDGVESVHRATNSMKDELVEEVRQASFAAGVKSETDKK